jgi:uncharacterized SAM-binding protein YcdF (DUF218 family)
MTYWRKRFLRIAAAFFVVLLLLGAMLYFFPQPFLCVDSGPATAEVIIVLGGGGTHERPIRAADLYKEHAAPRVLISGAGDGGINRHILLKDGVPAADVEIEGKSRTTRQNAEFSIAILRAEGVHSAIIVTSWYHSRRALRTFEHYGPGIKFYSRPSYFWYRHGHWTYDFFRHVYLEYIKLPGYWVTYGVCPF